LGEPLRFGLRPRSRRAIRSITFAGFALLTRYGGSASIPLAANAPTKRNKKRILVENILDCCILLSLSFFSPKHTLKIMAHGKTIKFFLIDGKPDGRMFCELSNWTGKAYRIPRMQIKDSGDRPDLKKPGVYLLLSNDESGNQIYIGESESIFDRLNQHMSTKDFFKEVIAFISKDDNLNKAHIKYLEHNLYRLASNSKRYSITNAQNPPKPAISESDQAEMQEFLENIKILVNAMGHNVFIPQPQLDKTEQDFMLKVPKTGADATGNLTNDNRFVVFKGSKAANKINDSASPTIKRLRQELIDNGILFLNADVYEFKDDHIFGSPSTAGGIVTGGNVNGLTAWLRKNDSVTLKDAAI
jgi:hypothetical protein